MTETIKKVFYYLFLPIVGLLWLLNKLRPSTASTSELKSRREQEKAETSEQEKLIREQEEELKQTRERLQGVQERVESIQEEINNGEGDIDWHLK